MRATLELIDVPTTAIPATDGFPQPWAWFRGDDLTGYADDDPVTDLLDRAGGAGTLPHIGTTDDALYRGSAIGGQPGIYIDVTGSGGNYEFRSASIASPSGAQGITVAIVFSGLEDAGPGEESVGANIQVFGSFDPSGSIFQAVAFSVYDNGTYGLYSGMLGQIWENPSVRFDGSHMVIVRWATNSEKVWLDGGLVFDETGSLAVDDLEFLRVVTHDNDDEPAQPTVTDIMVWDVPLDDAAVAHWWTYGQDRYSL